jgi:hypothetical protein
VQVETYFSDTNALASTYWIGVERVDVINSLYQLADGTKVGNGYVSNTGMPLLLNFHRTSAVPLPAACGSKGARLLRQLMDCNSMEWRH